MFINIPGSKYGRDGTQYHRVYRINWHTSTKTAEKVFVPKHNLNSFINVHTALENLAKVAEEMAATC
jgi:hypothetical protein